jgi:Uma2 family endonuclease
MLALQPQKHHTYTDYAGWDTDERYELIDGVPYLMSPAPTWRHQDISGALFTQLRNFLKGKPCKVFHSPFDVRLNYDKDDDTVVQPDILVYCDKSKLEGTGGKGAPDFIIEITSPSTANRDRYVKFNKYLQAGVREYWIVDPDNKTVTAHVLQNGKYITSAYGEEDMIDVHVLDGCRIDMKEAFEE